MNKTEKIKQMLKELQEMGFDSEQLYEMGQGIEKSIDITKYADPKFDWEQMREIWIGLEHNVDVSKYTNSDFNWQLMYEIRKEMEKEKE